MLVREAMTEDIVTASGEMSVEAAIGTILREAVGSVVIADDGAPVGIVSRSDLLRAVHESDQPLEEIPVSRVMRDLETIEGTRTLRSAAEVMGTTGRRKLVVTENLRVVGVLTFLDIVGNYPALKSEIADALDASDSEWGRRS